MVVDDDDDGWLVPLGFYQQVELSISIISNHSSSFGWLHSFVCWFKSTIYIYTYIHDLFKDIWEYWLKVLFSRAFLKGIYTQ
jgi:hypothetical protein